MLPALPMRSSIVVISDRLERGIAEHFSQAWAPVFPDQSIALPEVLGGYLERLPLAAINQGLVDFAEIWHHSDGAAVVTRDNAHVTRRVFPVDSEIAPFHSTAMLDFIAEFGAPRILCIWGLGVSEDILEACSDSIIIYNSIDAPSLRVPPEISRHFDLVLTGAEWQSDEVVDRHPGVATAILPIGPEFASPETFYPIDTPKLYDVIYVAAAQAYKRHDVLFAALATAPRPLKALCVMGYGEDADRLRQQAADQGLDVDFVGPPGVDYSEVNRLMNLARVGVVCGRDDGAPAILTEYMLAGLPVVANAELACGLQYILPETGLVAAEENFAKAIIAAIDHPERFSPRQAVLERWAWPHSIARLAPLLRKADTHLFPHHAAHSGQPEGGFVESANPA